MSARKLQLLILGMAGLVTTGCTYSTERPFRKDVRSVYVKPFDTRIFRRRVEMNLTEAIKKRIQMDAPYKLAGQKDADTILKGEVLEVHQATLGREFLFAMPRETQLTVDVSFEWKDLRSGKILVKRDHWLQTYDYSRPAGENEWIGLQGVVDRIAETIVEQLEEDW